MMRNPQHRDSLFFSPWKKPGIFFLGLILFACNPVWAIAEPPPDLPTVLIDGEVILIHIDEIILEESRMAYFLKLHGKDEVVEMIFDKRPPHSLRTGVKIRAKGKLAHKKVWVSEVAFLDGESSTGGQSGASIAEATTGSRRAIVMLLNMMNAPYSESNIQPYGDQTVQQVGQDMFALDQFSVNSTYQEASLGQLSFPGGPSTDVFVVSIPYDNSCAYRTMASQADAVVPVDLGAYQQECILFLPEPFPDVPGWPWERLEIMEVTRSGNPGVPG